MIELASDSLTSMSIQELIELQNKVAKALKTHHNWFNTDRPSWDEYGVYIAHAVSLRGSCLRRKAGAVFFNKNHDIIATGYNGKGAGATNCSVSPCKGASAHSGTALSDCEAIHAEVNALLRCIRKDEIHTVYVTCSPCVSCVDILIGTSAERIVFAEQYPHNEESRRRWLASRPGREWVHFQSDRN